MHLTKVQFYALPCLRAQDIPYVGLYRALVLGKLHIPINTFISEMVLPTPSAANQTHNNQQKINVEKQKNYLLRK